MPEKVTESAPTVHAEDKELVNNAPTGQSTSSEVDKQKPGLHVRKACGRGVLIAIGLGQLLSLLICGTAVTSGLLQQEGIYIPTAQSFLNYVLLCMTYTIALSCQKGEDNIIPVLRNRGWKYFLLGVVDVEANYLIVKAYHYTTVTSVQLLDCFTIPTVLFLSWLFLRVRYKVIHVVGVVLCIFGVAALVGADILVSKSQGEGKNKVLGDMLCLLGAMLYGVSNVAQEFVVRNFNRVEFLGMLGLFGSIINGVQFAILERQEVALVDFTAYKSVLPLVGFAVCMYVLYSLMPVVMKLSSATSVNLNLLSADFYALLVGLFLFHYQFHFLYFISFALIIIGIIVYSARPPPVVPQQGEYREMCAQEDTEAPPGGQSNDSGVTYQTDRTARPTPLTAQAETCAVGLQVAKYTISVRQDDPSAEDQKHLMQYQEGSNSRKLTNIPEESPE